MRVHSSEAKLYLMSLFRKNAESKRDLNLRASLLEERESEITSEITQPRQVPLDGFLRSNEVSNRNNEQIQKKNMKHSDDGGWPVYDSLYSYAHALTDVLLSVCVVVCKSFFYRHLSPGVRRLKVERARPHVQLCAPTDWSICRLILF